MQSEGYAEKRRLFLTAVNDAIDSLDEATAQFGRSHSSTLAALDNALHAVERAEEVMVVTRLSS